MKYFKAIVIVLITASALQACRHSTPQISTAGTDSVSDKPDTASTINLSVDKEDSDFAADAANGNISEVAMGQLAVKNGRSKKVKNFGLMMIKDHGKANTALMALSKTKNLNLPTVPNADAQKMITGLSKKTGDAFDKAYINAMIADHQEDIKKFTYATTKVQDPDLQRFAIKTLPVLQKHLDAINAIQDSMDK